MFGKKVQFSFTNFFFQDHEKVKPESFGKRICDGKRKRTSEYIVRDW